LQHFYDIESIDGRIEKTVTCEHKSDDPQQFSENFFEIERHGASPSKKLML